MNYIQKNVSFAFGHIMMWTISLMPFRGFILVDWNSVQAETPLGNGFFTRRSLQIRMTKKLFPLLRLTKRFHPHFWGFLFFGGEGGGGNYTSLTLFLLKHSYCLCRVIPTTNRPKEWLKRTRNTHVDIFAQHEKA